MFAVFILKAFCFFFYTLAHDTFWALDPEPTLFHPAKWDYEEIRLVSNDSSLLGRSGSSFIYPCLVKLFNFQSYSDSLPLCFFFCLFFAFPLSPTKECLLIRLRLLRASQDNDNIWSLNITFPLDAHESIRFIPVIIFPLWTILTCDAKLSGHSWDNMKPDTGLPNWMKCVIP